MQIWVLTEVSDRYDHYGECFTAVFGSKPKHHDLTKHGVPQNQLAHTLKGGGRKDHEGVWFYLRSHEVADT